MAGKKGFGGGSGGILALEIKDEAELYEHYMSFVSAEVCLSPPKKVMSWVMIFSFC